MSRELLQGRKRRKTPARQSKALSGFAPAPVRYRLRPRQAERPRAKQAPTRARGQSRLLGS